MKAAPGQGIVSSIVLESDDLDEIDWECKCLTSTTEMFTDSFPSHFKSSEETTLRFSRTFTAKATQLRKLAYMAEAIEQASELLATLPNPGDYAD